MKSYIYIDSISSPSEQVIRSTSRKKDGPQKSLVRKRDCPYNPAIESADPKQGSGCLLAGQKGQGIVFGALDTASRHSGPFSLEALLDRSQKWIADPKLKSAMGAKPFALFQALVQHLYSKKKLFVRKPILFELGFMSRKQMIFALGMVESPEAYGEVESLIRYLESGTPWGGWIKAFYVNAPNKKNGATRFWIPLRLLKRKLAQVFSSTIEESKPDQILESQKAKREEGLPPPWVSESIKTEGFSKAFASWMRSGFQGRNHGGVNA